MTKKIFILLIVVLGLITGPTQSYAAGMDSVMSCCTKESATKDCCKEEGTKHQEHHCDSSCAGTSCGCPTVYTSSTPIFLTQTTNNALFDSSEKAQKFYFSEIFISSDFRSIWLPPKIG